MESLFALKIVEMKVISYLFKFYILLCVSLIQVGPSPLLPPPSVILIGTTSRWKSGGCEDGAGWALSAQTLLLLPFQPG